MGRDSIEDSQVSRARYIAYRVTWAGAASLVVSVVLFAVAVEIGDPRTFSETAAALPDLPPDANQFWDPGAPVYVQYLDWLGSMLTLQWGTSIRFGEPVAQLFLERAKITATYLLPAVALGTVGATGFGYLAAHRQGEWSDGLVRGVGYLALAVPNFVLAGAFARYIRQRSYELDARTFTLEADLLGEWNAVWLAAAALLLGTHVAATQVGPVRAQSSEYLAADFARMLRAKGLGWLRVARHVLRAAAVPLASLFVAEVVGLLLVSVFVIEAVLGIRGIGFVTWQAAAVNDLPVVLAATFLVSLSVIVAGVIEDLAAVLLDPRLEAET